MSPPAPASSTSRALFLDVDGTLLDIAPTPDTVHVPPELKGLLQRLSEAHGGALALVSGRPIARIDELFTPLRLPSAGLHGLQWRSGDGTTLEHSGDLPPPDQMRLCLTAFAARYAGTFVEDKGGTLALHYRLAPQHSAAARAAALEAQRLAGEEWQLLEGKYVLELMPRTTSKARAIEKFMRIRPFAGRTPVFAGDDHTDETGFAWVNAAGGDSIHVGNAPDTCAHRKMANVAALHEWLRSLLEGT